MPLIDFLFLSRDKKRVYYLLSFVAFIFLVLTLFVLIDPISIVDKELSEEIQEHHNLLLDTVMRSISWFGYMPNTLYFVGFISFLFVLSDLRKEALCLILTLLSGVITTIVKMVVNRPRPSSDLVRVIEVTRQQSFPSGHVTFYVVFFGLLMLIIYRLKKINRMIRFMAMLNAGLLIFLIPISRIYLGAHWFTDVLAGFLLGLLGLYAISFYYLRMLQK